MKAVPRRLIVLGGGPVGWRWPRPYAAWREVALINNGDHVLAREPAPLGEALVRCSARWVRVGARQRYAFPSASTQPSPGDPSTRGPAPGCATEAGRHATTSSASVTTISPSRRTAVPDAEHQLDHRAGAPHKRFAQRRRLPCETWSPLLIKATSPPSRRTAWPSPPRPDAAEHDQATRDGLHGSHLAVRPRRRVLAAPGSRNDPDPKPLPVRRCAVLLLTLDLDHTCPGKSAVVTAGAGRYLARQPLFLTCVGVSPRP